MSLLGRTVPLKRHVIWRTTGQIKENSRWVVKSRENCEKRHYNQTLFKVYFKKRLEKLEKRRVKSVDSQPEERIPSEHFFKMSRSCVWCVLAAEGTPPPPSAPPGPLWPSLLMMYTLLYTPKLFPQTEQLINWSSGPITDSIRGPSPTTGALMTLGAPIKLLGCDLNVKGPRQNERGTDGGQQHLTLVTSRRETGKPHLTPELTLLLDGQFNCLNVTPIKYCCFYFIFFTGSIFET